MARKKNKEVVIRDYCPGEYYDVAGYYIIFESPKGKDKDEIIFVTPRDEVTADNFRKEHPDWKETREVRYTYNGPPLSILPYL
jgi:hypothetical protein